MAIILKNLHVDCYRGINQLDLEDFNHVNILVGDNNAGKTSVMEMIYALTDPLSMDTWNEIVANKCEHNRGILYFSAFQNLFPIDKEKRIEFNSDFSEKGSCSVVLTGSEYKTSIPEGELKKINGWSNSSIPYVDDAYVDASVLELSISSGDKHGEFKIYDFQRRAPHEKIINLSKNSKNKAVFIEPRNGLENDFSYMKDVILDSEDHRQLIEILKEFDPSITDIITVEEYGNIVYYLRTSDHTKAVPISVYGDGLKKALMIFAALASNKGGVVLIDEVESSIHTSAMNKVFSTLISWAGKLGIQLFVSTHSKEALDTLLNCDREYSDGVNVYTLYRNDHKNYVRKLSCQGALDLQNKMGMELR